MSTSADFVFTVNITMAVEDTGSIEDAASILETAVWDNMPAEDYLVESCFVTGRLA